MPDSFKYFDRAAPNKIGAPASVKIGGHRVLILCERLGLRTTVISIMTKAGTFSHLSALRITYGDSIVLAIYVASE
jgi:hypothetical protein